MTANTEAKALRHRYDFIVCGAGPAGCIAASRLATNLRARVLLIEAGAFVRSKETDTASMWPSNVGSERDWNFKSESESGLSNRMIGYSMGKLVGGGSSINASVWARGHQADWDLAAQAAGDLAWSYEEVLSIYRRVENYTGNHEKRYHGSGGPLTVEPSLTSGDIDPAGLCGSFLAASTGIGIPGFSEQNGALQEAPTGVSVTDLAVHGGRRSSLIDGYLAPALATGNLDLATDTMVTKVRVRGGRAVGVEVSRNGDTAFIEADNEVIVAAGAIQTPKLLLHSGIGERRLLPDAGIECVVHLPGVGRNLQDHPLVSLSWRSSSCPPVSASAQAVAFLDIGASATAPDAYLLATEIPSPARNPEEGVSWAIGAALLTPASRGRVTVADGDPARAPLIHANYFSERRDLDVLKRALETASEIGNSNAMKHLTSTTINKPEGGVAGIERYIASNTRSGWHLCGTCKMGGDDLAVVDGMLRVHGVANLRVCDTSVLPNVTRGNTMAPAIVIGEQMARILASAY